jgi:tetratricopeptide (TPR) repeat protein
MMGPLVNNITALFVAALLFLPACIPQNKAEVDLELRESEQNIKKHDVELALRDSKQDIGKGDLDGALAVYDAALRKYPGDHGLLTYYLEAAEDIRDAADDAFDQEEFAVSGRTYAVLLRNYPNFKEIDRDLSYDRKYLRARLKECSDRLSKLALTQYRQGNLTTAISLWKNILEFEPGNAGVKKAIDTASTQLKNLKQKTE